MMTALKQKNYTGGKPDGKQSASLQVFRFSQGCLFMRMLRRYSLSIVTDISNKAFRNVGHFDTT
jgi:hypothetical protein